MMRLKMIRIGVVCGALAIGGAASARYLQPEPMLAPVPGPVSVYTLNVSAPASPRRTWTDAELRRKLEGEGGPAFITEQAKMGFSVPAYSYANNNPLYVTDPDGRIPLRRPYSPNCTAACNQARLDQQKETGNSCSSWAGDSIWDFNPVRTPMWQFMGCLCFGWQVDPRGGYGPWIRWAVPG